MLDKQDISYLKENGISEDNFNSQLLLLKKNNCFVDLVRPATIGDGIVKINNIDKYLKIYNDNNSGFDIQKFVPASGAATRMFKRLINFRNNPDIKNFNDGDFYSVRNTFENIENFAFISELRKYNLDIKNQKDVADKILYTGLGYADKPKGLIGFHKYGDRFRTAFQEHIVEAIKLGHNGKPLKLHFTISKEFEDLFLKQQKKIETELNINFDISFSFQEKHTDTIAIYEDESIVRGDDNNILLRPGGHGALIENLDNLDSNFVFIKNIDNVVHESHIDITINYKKLLAGIIIEVLDTVYKINNDPSKDEFADLISYLNNNFGTAFSANTKINDIKEFVNKPIRVCGMVKNTGEPGGGPFWVKSKEGKISLQIVEKSQVDLSNQDQQEIFDKSTHFNPVDIICYLEDINGKHFDLKKYIDSNASFIAEKTYNGKTIRVIEHPGLWNGGMSDWLTLFIEVPIETFNPVKELNDLLRKEHQS